MDPVKKEAPLVNADQNLMKETGGEPGGDNSQHVEATRKKIAQNIGLLSDQIMPDAEKAGNLMETQTDHFLKKVAEVQEENEPGQAKISDSVSGLNELGKTLSGFSPFEGDEEDNVREMPSEKADELNLKRQEQMKAK